MLFLNLIFDVFYGRLRDLSYSLRFFLLTVMTTKSRLNDSLELLISKLCVTCFYLFYVVFELDI